MCFGEALPRRNIDQRMVADCADSDFSDFPASKMTAAELRRVGQICPPSRFLHLFKEQTGVSFRAFRAWKRARHLLHFVNEDINLAHLAQDIGYPELDAFQPFDPPVLRIEPRAIFSGSRDLAIYRSDSGVLDSAGFRQGRP